MNEAALLHLLTWLSPAFPTGGFAYSHGLEWSVEAGDVTKEDQLTDWLQDTLRHGALRTDAVLLRQAHQGGDIAALAELATSLSTSAERRLETLAQGTAFCAASAPWPAASLTAWAGQPLPYPLAVGMLATAQNVDEDDTVLAYLHAATANLVSAGIRLIPLGQAAGLRVQKALEPVILTTLSETKSATLDDLGSCGWASEIASMRHETQPTRLFRT